MEETLKGEETMKTYTLYKHTLPDGKIYIGCTARAPEVRWAGGHGYQKNQRFYEAILYHGWSNIDHEIIASNLDKESAFRLEHELIVSHRSYEPERGYNVSTGFGRTGFSIKHSEETRNKISQSRIGKMAGKDSPVARAVFCVELNCVFDTAKQAQDMTGVNKAHICQVCRGQRKRAGKMHWEYA